MCLEIVQKIVHERFFFIFFRDEIRDGGQGRVATRSCEARLAWPPGRKGNEHQCPPIHQRLLFSQKGSRSSAQTSARKQGGGFRNRARRRFAWQNGLHCEKRPRSPPGPGPPASPAAVARCLLSKPGRRRVRSDPSRARPSLPHPPTHLLLSLSSLRLLHLCRRLPLHEVLQPKKFNISVTERNHGLRDLGAKKT